MATRERGGGRLNREDWTRAALDALAEGGIGALAVEPLAARIGTTKGSFYWHFTHRDALIEATLHDWEERSTEQVIQALDREPDPRARLALLFATVMEGNPARRIELALLGAADHPLVAPALRRLTDRRIGYVASIFTELGLPPAEARARAVLAFTAYLGTAHLARIHPETLPTTPEAWHTYRAGVIELLLTGVPG